VTGNTHSGIHMDTFTVFPEHSVRTTLDTAAAEHALVMINGNTIMEGDASDTHCSILPMMGSPAFGMIISPTSGSMVLIAASSLEM
jgi:hypothetical protein